MSRPGLTWATRDDWLRFYRVGLPDGTVVTLGDDRMWAPRDNQPELLHRADALIALGIMTTERVIVAGCGPGGFLVEALKMRGLVNVWGFDSSPWVTSRTGIVAGGVVLINADMASGANFNRALRDATGAATFDWIVSESVLESYDDADITVLLNIAEGMRAPQVPMSHIVHIVFTPPFDEPGVFNEKTMPQWKAMRPTHTWMNGEGYGVQA